MRIVIVGGGKVGRSLCAELSESQHDIMLVEQKADIIDTLMSKYDITGIVGNGCNYEVQKEAGVNHADIFIAATDKDEVNIIASILAKKNGARYTVARVRNPEYAQQLEFLKEAFGISLLINPELLAARDIARTLRYASALSVQALAGNRVSLVEIEVTKHSPLQNIVLNSFREKFGSVLVCIVKRGEDVFIPSGTTELRLGDKIHVAGLPGDMNKFHRNIGNREKSIRSAFIIGGGKIAYYLLNLLEGVKMDIKVIESDFDRCEALSVEFPHARVIHADGTDTEILDEQSLTEYDSFISLTGVDEENLVASIYAIKKGVRKVITKMSRTNILKVLDSVDLKKVVTPKQLVASEISRFVRSRANAEGSNVEALYRVSDGAVEVLQFKVCSTFSATNVPLSQLSFKKNLLVAYIIRNGKLIFPNGQDSIHENDRVIVVTTEKDLTDLSDILA